MQVKKYVPFTVMSLCAFMFFCQSALSSSISISPVSLVLDVQNAGTVTVKILSDRKVPLSNIPVKASSSSETVATVSPGEGMTDANGRLSFTINGVSNGTATVSFVSSILKKNLPVMVVSNVAPCAIASSSDGGIDEFGPEMMNDEVEREDCSYHWIRTRDEFGRKKQGWIRLDWSKNVTISRMIVQTTDCNDSCGDGPDDYIYIDQGRNIGNGVVQYLDEDEITWITDGEFTDETGDVEYSFTAPITTKAIRVRRLSPTSACKGQQSNPVVFEWKAYGTPPCN